MEITAIGFVLKSDRGANRFRLLGWDGPTNCSTRFRLEIPVTGCAYQTQHLLLGKGLSHSMWNRALRQMHRLCHAGMMDGVLRTDRWDGS